MTNHRSRIEPRGTERFQTGTGLTLGQFLAAGITKQRPMAEAGRSFTQSRKEAALGWQGLAQISTCLLYTSPSPRDLSTSRMPSSA